MFFIEMIEPEVAEGQLKEVYEEVLKKRGTIADVYKVQSLNPASIIHHMELYLGIMFGKSPLRRYQREMIAVIVSANNQCEYCQTYHGIALNNFWKDEPKVQQLRTDYTKVALSEVDQLLCELAKNLTLNPGHANEAALEPLKKAGLEDRAILDATLVIAYFNFANRLVMGLGVSLDNQKDEWVHYD